VNGTTIRYHYMDNLRALAMLAGIFFHGALAYSPMMANVWLSADPATSPLVDVVAWFSHLFRMPLFFLIAGFFACYLVEKRGVTGFLRNRATRILVPFAIFWPLVLFGIIATASWALQNVENRSPMLQVIAWMATNPDAAQPPTSTTHLWFLYNLCQFYIVYVVLHRLGIFSMRWNQTLSSVRFLVYVLPLLLVPALFTQTVPHPAPEQFMPRLWSFGYFGIFFLLGSHLFRNQGVIDKLKPYAIWMGASSLVLYTILYYYVPKSFSLQDLMAMQQGASASWPHFGMSILEAYISVHMTFACLVAGKALLDNANAAFRYIADSSYWVYIIHLPLLFYIQFLLLDVSWGIWIEFGISSFGTLGIGVLTYALFVRRTPIGWLLNGKKTK